MTEPKKPPPAGLEKAAAIEVLNLAAGGAHGLVQKRAANAMLCDGGRIKGIGEYQWNRVLRIAKEESEHLLPDARVRIAPRRSLKRPAHLQVTGTRKPLLVNEEDRGKLRAIRCSDKRWEAIREAAKAAGETITDYVLAAAEVRGSPSRDNPLPENGELFSEEGAFGEPVTLSAASGNLWISVGATRDEIAPKDAQRLGALLLRSREL